MTSLSSNQPPDRKAIFRKDSVEQLLSPDNLEQRAQVVHRRSWIPLTAAGILVSAVLAWSFLGRIPVTVTGQGILIRPGSVEQLQAQGSGLLLKLMVKSGDRVKKGQVIGVIDQFGVTLELKQAQQQLQALQRDQHTEELLEHSQLLAQRQALAAQRLSLVQSLRTGESVMPLVEERAKFAEKQQHASVEVNLENAKAVLPKLKERYETRRQLVEEGAVAKDTLLQSEQEYLNAVNQVANLEAQLVQSGAQKLEAKKQFLDQKNNLKSLKYQIDQVDSQVDQLETQTVTSKLNRQQQVDQLKDRIQQLQNQIAQQGRIISPYTGRILDLVASPGELVQAGSRIGSVEFDGDDREVVTLAYFPNQSGEQIKADLSTQITPSEVEKARYGGIIGKVQQVTLFPVTTDTITAQIGNPEVARQLAGQGGAIQVFLKMERDPANESGFKWSSSKGPATKFHTGTLATVEVKVGERAPISYVIPLLRSLTGLE